MDAHGRPDRGNATCGPEVPSHQPHRGADEEAKTDGESQYRKKEKSGHNDYQDLNGHAGSTLKEGFLVVGRPKLLCGDDDSAGGEHVANPGGQKPGTRTIVRMVRKLSGKEDHNNPQRQHRQSAEDSRMPHANPPEEKTSPRFGLRGVGEPLMMISLSGYLSSPSSVRRVLNCCSLWTTKVENSLLLIQEGLSIYCSKYFSFQAALSAMRFITFS